MVVKVAGLGRSFVGVTAYCLHDRREPGEPQPETDERVEWTTPGTFRRAGESGRPR